MNKPTLILMGRWHAASRCKRRLARQIGIERAAAVQKKLTRHTISVAKALEEKGVLDIQMAISGIGAKAAKRWAKSEGLKNITIQGEGSLGLRMKRQLFRNQAAKKGYREKIKSTIIIGTDLPSLCTQDLIEALDSLKRNEMVIGPSKDGGYWLIGLSGELVHPIISWPFCGIPWGSDQVLKTTIQKANLEGISPKFLSLKNDIDNIEDLSPWQK